MWISSEMQVAAPLFIILGLPATIFNFHIWHSSFVSQSFLSVSRVRLHSFSLKSFRFFGPSFRSRALICFFYLSRWTLAFQAIQNARKIGPGGHSYGLDDGLVVSGPS